MRSTARMPALALVAVAAGCAGGVRDDDAARTAFLVQSFADGDRALLLTRPALVAGKYAKMAGSLQDYVRGTARVHYLDVQRLLGDETYRHGAGAELVELYGDVHMENVGASFDDETPGQGMLLDCTDFDATVRAPFDWEVRRAVTTLAVALGLGDRDEPTMAAVGRALVAGYLDALVRTVDEGEHPPPLRPGMLGAILEKTVATAQRRRDARDELASYTLDAHPRRFLTRVESDGELDAVPEPFASALPELMRAYRAVRRGGPGEDARFAIKSAAQKLGSGVSSFANLRFWVLVENGPGDDDDVILELKEERDPPEPLALLGRGAEAPIPYSNATRVYGGELTLLSSDRMDPDLGYVIWGGVSFLVRRETAGRRNFDVAGFAEQLKAGKWEPVDLDAFGRTVGRLVGGGHARGGSAAAILRAVGDRDAWTDRTVTAALDDRARIVRDYDLFRRALQERGPLLGIRP